MHDFAAIGRLGVPEIRRARAENSVTNALCLSAALLALAATRLLAADLTAPTIPQESPTPLTMTVLAYDYVGVPAEIFKGAEQEASRVYRDIGIEIAWRAEDPNAPTRHFTPTVTNAARGFTVAVIITSAVMTNSQSHANDLMGTTFRSPRGDGWIAYVFYPHVEMSAPRDHASLATILGHVFAHEIGHLLLPLNSHSPDGLMRADWDPAHLRRAIAGTLRFTTEQAELMRAKMRDALASPTSVDGFPRVVDVPRAADDQ